MKKSLTIAWLYPDLMSTYGDRGNIIVLKKRCQWRDIAVEVKEVTLETPISDLKKCDLIFMGGAQDRQQKILGDDFATYQYTTSYDFTMFQGSTAQYLMLLPWQHYFTIYGGY